MATSRKPSTPESREHERLYKQNYRATHPEYMRRAREITRAYKRAHPDHVRNQNREYRAANPHVVRAMARSHRAKKDPERYGIHLTGEQVAALEAMECHYCGRSRARDGTPIGIDRLDSCKPYTEENTVPSCGYDNVGKGAWTEREFLAHVARIVYFQRGYEACVDAETPCFPQSGSYAGACRDAKARGLEFSLTREEVTALRAQPCTYCGRAATPPAHRSGMDRVDSSRGYVEGNVVPACWQCNRLKGAAATAEFLAQAGRIVAHRMTATEDPE